MQFQQGQFDAALASLNQVKSQGFSARKDLLAGDIQVAKGDVNGAKASFENVQKKRQPVRKTNGADEIK